MKIVVISDIHSNLEALRAIVDNLPHYDALFFLGDLVGYGPRPDEVVKLLQALQPTAAIAGNHDYGVVTGEVRGFTRDAAMAVEWTRQHIEPQSLAYLSSLQSSRRIELANTRVALFHGSPRDPLSEYVFPDISGGFAREMIGHAGAPIVLLGHTHIPMIFRLKNEMLANPGSVGQPRDGDPRAAFAILTLDDGVILSFEIKRIDYDVGHVANDIIQVGLPKFLAERLHGGM